MPEGDTVWLATHHLDQALAGFPLLRTDFRVPDLATVDLSGRTVIGVVPRGKHLLMRLSPDVTVHSHLRMDGSWHLYRPGARWSGGPAHEVRVVLETEPWVAVGYRMHDLAIVPTSTEDTLVGHLGPDLLGPDWNLDLALERLRASPTTQVAVALLDQRNLAGIGNMYQAEALFLCGINPWTPVAEVPDLAALVLRAQRLLDANKAHAAQNTTGDRRRGHEHWVYGRAGRPCRRCGTVLRSAEQGEPPRARISYWCPTCQPLPASESTDPAS